MESKLYGQNKGGMSINGIIKDYYAYAGENVKAGDLVEYVNGIAGRTDYGTSEDTQLNTARYTGYSMSAVALDDSRVFIVHGSDTNTATSNYLYGVTVTISGATITCGTDTQLSSESSTGRTVSACLLPNGSVFVAHTYSSSYRLYGMIVSIDGTTITAGTDTAIVTRENAGWSISTELLPNGNVFIAHSYYTNYHLYGIVVSVNGTTITAGTDTALSTTKTSGYVISTCLLPNGNVFIAHSYNSDYYLYGIVVSVNGTTVTKGTDTQLSTTANTARVISTCLLSNNNIFIAHNSSTSYYLYGMVATVNETTVTYGIDTQLSTTANTGWAVSICLLQDGSVFIAHSNSADRYLYGMIATINDATITTGPDIELDSVVNSGYVIKSLMLSNGTMLVAHTHDNGYGLDAQIWSVDGNIPTNNIVAPYYETQVRKVTTGQFDGVAKTNGTGGDDTGHNDLVSIYTLDENEIPNGTQEFAMADGNTLVDANGDVFMVKEE